MKKVFDDAYTEYRIRELYKNVELIKVDYETEHNTALLHAIDNGTLTFTPDMQAIFVISCPNRNDCTAGGLDIGSKISGMVHRREPYRQFEEQCRGNEAADHPEQQCQTIYRFAVSIRFSKS